MLKALSCLVCLVADSVCNFIVPVNVRTTLSIVIKLLLALGWELLIILGRSDSSRVDHVNRRSLLSLVRILWLSELVVLVKGLLLPPTVAKYVDATSIGKGR